MSPQEKIELVKYPSPLNRQRWAICEWLLQLAPLTKHHDRTLPEAVVAMATALAPEFGPEVFTQDNLIYVARRVDWFPSYSKLRLLLLSIKEPQK